MNISTERHDELAEMFENATLDNALDAVEWLVHVQDVVSLDDTLETTINDLKHLCGHTMELSYYGDAAKRAEALLHKQQEIKLKANEPKPFDRIFSMFQKAKDSGLDWPKIVLGGDLNLTLSMNAKGVINITNGQRYGTPSNVWYGRISPAGSAASKDAYMSLRENQPDVDKGTIQQHIKDFDTDPAKSAQLYGHQTGSCMFCARKLTNPVSVTVGYGPICAMNFGLPHEGIKGESRLVEKQLGEKK